MNKAYLLIGGNMGNRANYLAMAKEKLEKECGMIVSQSSIYETAAWGLEDQDAFLNQAVEMDTHFNAQELLQAILDIEKSLGRIRDTKYGPRIIDIDILLFNNEIIHTAALTIPHPQMQNRRFVLVPLNDIAGDAIHPVFQKSISQLLLECPDNLAVQKFR